MFGTSPFDTLLTVAVAEPCAKRTKLLDQRLRIDAGSRVVRRLVVLVDSSAGLANIATTALFVADLIKTITQFLNCIFAESPLTEVAIVTLQAGKAFLENGFSPSMDAHRRALQKEFLAEGALSLCRGLSLALDLFREALASKSMDVVFLNFSNNTVDSTDVFTLAADMVRDGVRLNAVSMACGMHVLDTVTQMTGGTHRIIRRGAFAELYDLLMSFYCTGDAGSTGGAGPRDAAFQVPHDLVAVGFPAQKSLASKATVSHLDSVCFCHGRYNDVYYECPGCKAISCEPRKCQCCGLQLAIYAHLAQSANQYKSPWEPAPCALPPSGSPTPVKAEGTGSPPPPSAAVRCSMCASHLLSGQRAKASATYACADCQKIFCSSCKDFARICLRACPFCGTK